uniref:Uncharacterized protein n=1 Tax=Arundo donax TaxID=35708 RepID=A0A0A9AJT0_ARUDO
MPWWPSPLPSGLCGAIAAVRMPWPVSSHVRAHAAPLHWVSTTTASPRHRDALRAVHHRLRAPSPATPHSHRQPAPQCSALFFPSHVPRCWRFKVETSRYAKTELTKITKQYPGKCP